MRRLQIAVSQTGCGGGAVDRVAHSVLFAVTAHFVKATWPCDRKGRQVIMMRPDRPRRSAEGGRKSGLKRMLYFTYTPTGVDTPGTQSSSKFLGSRPEQRADLFLTQNT